MTASLLERVLVPVANEEDTEATCAAIEPYLGEIGEIVLVHVVEQTPGYMDHGSPEALAEDAQRFLAMARRELSEDTVVRAEVRYGDDVAAEIADEADEVEATAIVFHPRDKGLLAQLVDGDHEGQLIRAGPVPVIALTG
jgi:nucleotide-binding universal stress UspA family protein